MSKSGPQASEAEIEDQDRHRFTLCQYDRDSGKWTMAKAPVYHIVD
jgi:hypothetical protein